MGKKDLKNLQENKSKTGDKKILESIKLDEKIEFQPKIRDLIELSVNISKLKNIGDKCNLKQDYSLFRECFELFENKFEIAKELIVNGLPDRESKSDEYDSQRDIYSFLSKRNRILDKSMQELKSGYLAEERSEHEITRLFVSDKIDNLSSELAKKDDLIEAKDEIIEKIESESKVIQEKLENKIEELKKTLNSYLPHKRVFRISTFFMSVLLFSIFSDLFLGIQIIKPYWATLGLLVSGGFLTMSYFSFLEWKKSINNGEFDK